MGLGRATLVTQTRSPVTGIQMKIRLLFFGVLKDMLGRSAETIDLPEGARVSDVLSYYAQKAPGFDAMMSSLATSVNQEYSAADRPLREGDEVGLLPPVSGGSPAGSEERAGRVRDELIMRKFGSSANGSMPRLLSRDCSGRRMARW